MICCNFFCLAVPVVQCDPVCKGGQGTCQSNGRCFCWWGWTGPNATYITSGKDKNRILVLITSYFLFYCVVVENILWSHSMEGHWNFRREGANTTRKYEAMDQNFQGGGVQIKPPLGVEVSCPWIIWMSKRNLICCVEFTRGLCLTMYLLNKY